MALSSEERSRATSLERAIALLQQSEPAQPVLIMDIHLTGLPEVMQRYLRYAGVVDKEPIRTVRLTQQGLMRQQPDQKWMPLVAEQYFTTKPPAFLLAQVFGFCERAG